MPLRTPRPFTLFWIRLIFRPCRQIHTSSAHSYCTEDVVAVETPREKWTRQRKKGNSTLYLSIGAGEIESRGVDQDQDQEAIKLLIKYGTSYSGQSLNVTP